jgi:hypothetical protein
MIKFNSLIEIAESYNIGRMTISSLEVMGDAELLIVLCGAALLILATFFGTLRRRRHERTDYWLPDGSRVRRPKALD